MLYESDFAAKRISFRLALRACPLWLLSAHRHTIIGKYMIPPWARTYADYAPFDAGKQTLVQRGSSVTARP